MSRGLSGFAAARALIIAVLLLTLAPFMGAGAAQAAGPDAGTDRLLITEMAAIKSAAGRLSSSLARSDLDSAGAQVRALQNNWPAVRDELSRRDERGLIENFEASLGDVEAAIEAEDADAATAGAREINRLVGDANSSLGSVDVDVARVAGALVVPLLLIAAITAFIPWAARKMEVRL